MKVKSSKVVYKCPILQVEEREIVTPRGAHQTHWIVIRQPNVGVIALTSDKKIVLIKERRGKDDEEMIEIPGGKMEKFEVSENEAKYQAELELKQEAGYSAKNFKLLKKHSPTSNWYEREYYKFVAWDLEEVGQDLDEGESIDVVGVSPEKALEMIKNEEFSFSDEAKAVKEAIEFFKQKGLLS